MSNKILPNAYFDICAKLKLIHLYSISGLPLTWRLTDETNTVLFSLSGGLCNMGIYVRSDGVYDYNYDEINDDTFSNLFQPAIGFIEGTVYQQKDDRAHEIITAVMNKLAEFPIGTPRETIKTVLKKFVKNEF